MFIGILVGVIAFFILIIGIVLSVGGGNPREFNIISRVANVDVDYYRKGNKIMV